MASPKGSYGGYLEKIKDAHFYRRNKYYSQKVKLYKATVTRLESILNGKNQWTDNGKYEAMQALNKLKDMLSGEDLKDASIKDAHKAICDIERKLGIHKLGERGLPNAEYHFRDRTEGMRVHGEAHSTDKPVGPLQNIVTRRRRVENDISKEPKHNQMAVSGPPDDENFISFLREITSLIRDEQEHFSDKVLNWLKNRKNTEAGQALIESIVHQRSRTAKLETELRDCHDRLSQMNKATNCKESSRPADASKSTNTKVFESRNSPKEDKDNVKMQNSIELSDVLGELRVIEERLIVTYKTEDMEMHSRDRGNISKSRPQGNTKQIMRESLTALVDRVDDMMNYFAQKTKRLHVENSELAQQNRDMKADILAIKNNMEKLGKEKADHILRLSNIVGAKLTENNPSIADLSDPYRPTKLSERYLEIFDNEWTEAYEAMDKGGDMKEQQICLELLNILLKAELECREMAKTQFEQLCARCTSPVGPGENGQLDSIHLSLINDLQKQTANISISSVQKKILKDNKVSMKSDVVNYQKKCVEICWYMSLQTPPMVLDTSLKEGQAFDSERYNWYTRKGKYVEFIVWPPLLLHKEGPLLCKGVAQVK